MKMNSTYATQDNLNHKAGSNLFSRATNETHWSHAA
jgi:hypothetical protein